MAKLDKVIPFIQGSNFHWECLGHLFALGMTCQATSDRLEKLMKALLPFCVF